MSKFRLSCASCHRDASPADRDYRCAGCGGQLEVLYESRAELDTAAHGMWRYASRLPLEDPKHAVSLGEGGTPLVRVNRLDGLPEVWLKAEHMNPTGSFKDRIASVALSMVVERRLHGCVGTSSGNGGAAVAAYGARAGKPVSLFALVGTADMKLLQILATGADVHSVRGLGHDADGTRQAADTIARWAAEHDLLPFLTGGRYAPEAMEGAKTIAFELAEAAPQTTSVYVPVGGGGLLSSIWRGYAQAADWFGVTPPRIVAVQPAGCPTVRDLLAGGEGRLDRPTSTSVSGLQVAVLFDGRVAEALAGSGGHLVEVSDEEIWDAQRILAEKEGVLLEPAGATALAGVISDARRGALRPDEKVVAIATGAGFKDVDALRRLAAGNSVPEISVDELPGRLEAAFRGSTS
jgi:threonine synthase